MGWAERSKKNGNKPVHIMVAMPIHKYMESLTLVCWDSSVEALPSKGIGISRYSPIGNPYVDAARNRCIEHFLEKPQYTHLMWIDDDMVWTPDCIEKLVSFDAPVTSAIVTLKAPPFRPTLFEFASDETGMLNTFEIPFGRWPLDRPFTLPNSCIGTAFMLLKREVIEKMEQPYFTGFKTQKGQLKGTDIYFGAKINALGYEFIYDPTIRVYHVGRGIYGLEDHIAFLELKKQGVEAKQFSGEGLPDYKKSYAGPSQDLITAKIPEVNEKVAKIERGEVDANI